MASELIEIPDIRFGFYYHSILQSLLDFKRANLPELSDENEYEPTIQLLRAFALVGHMNNVVMDLIAQESMLRTAQLAESVREHLRLIDYEMAPARPSQVEVVLELSKVFNVATTVSPSGAQFATERDPETNIQIFFETDEQLSVNPTNEFTNVLAQEDGVFVDYTADANSVVTPGDDWSPWATPNDGDELYIGHDSVMWNRLDTFVTTDTVPGTGFGVWEYYSGDFAKAKPDSVAQVGDKLRFVINGYLGTKNRKGTKVRVQINSTTISEDLTVIWTGTENVIETTGLLGQSSVSTDVNNYTVGSDWEPLPSLTSQSGTGDLFIGQNDQVSWSLPQSITDNWKKTTVESIEAYWMRFRWIEQPTSGPTFQYITMSEAKHYAIVSTTQGRSNTDSPLGSSSGAPNQIFDASKTHFIDNGKDILEVDAVEWTRVDNFILSKPTDQHYVVQLTGADDRGQVKFGDGIRGQIPALGVSNISWEYRYGGENDGNVGPNTVISDKTSLTHVNSIFNPRQATGWSPAEGANESSLALAKELGPALLRTKHVAISADDLVPLTLRFLDDNGASPYSRAFAIEESFGPKTIELVVVAKGGGLASGAQLAELEEFYNGNKFANPPVPANLVSNQKVTATNHTQHTVNITATVYGSNVTVLQIQNHLKAVFDPEALQEDGVTYEWDFGETVSQSRVKHEIHKVSPSITNVILTDPSEDTELTFRELPKYGAINIKIVEPGA